jgi:putative peptidoglycan lipid II flippase
MSQMLKSSGALAAATLASRILGMVREIVYAGFMGATWQAGAFKLAFMIPNLFRRLLGEGALTAAFIPIFKAKEKTVGEAETWRAANAVISGLLIFSGGLILLVLGSISAVLRLIPTLEPQTVLMLGLLRWTFPYVLLACLAAVYIGMLNARGHFLVPALGTLILNVALIGSVFFLAPLFGKPDELSKQLIGLAVGVLIAGVFQAVFQFPLMRREGYRFGWVSPWRNETVREVMQKMLPASVGVAAFQINVVVTNGFAFFVDPRIIASFDYAVRLMELPQGVLGISMATYLLPTLSGLAVDKKYPEFRATLNKGMEHLLFLNLLAGVLLAVLAAPIIRLLFEHRMFSAGDTQDTAQALTLLAPGLIAYSLVNVMARAFYALGDTSTPMRISVACLITNLLLGVTLVFPLRQAGLALANSATAYLQLALLVYALRRKLPKLEFGELRIHLPRLIVCGITAGAVAIAMHWLWNTRIGHETIPAQLGEVFVPLASSAVTYWGLAWMMGIGSATEMAGLLFSRANGKQV